MANYGLKISKIGVDVKSAGDGDLIFTSKYPLLKIIKAGTLSYTFTSDPADGETVLMGTINHNFGYIPAHDSFVKYDTETFYKNIPALIDISSVYSKAKINTVDFEFICSDPFGDKDYNGKTIIIKYYIFADPGA
jgi:hypothetical protein